jgi:hypothetical protein
LENASDRVKNLMAAKTPDEPISAGLTKILEGLARITPTST